jgi:prepilin-type N-terminal cleavage/methylation domain-containing protein
MKETRGFTLVEMAIVLVILGLLLAGLLMPLSAQVDQRKISETQKAMDEIRDALIGFAVANGRLPCPAISAGNGQEDVTGGVCTGGKRVGFIPWATLGVSKLDAWGHIFRYSVTPAFASAAPFTLTTPRDITIQTRDAAGALVNLSNAGDIPAVVVSHGKNGFGSFSDNGTAQAPVPAANVDEAANGGSGTGFVSRVQADNPAAGGGAFDDMVAWVSPNTLFNRMVSAGRLP